MARFIARGWSRVWFYPEKGEPVGPFLVTDQSTEFGPYPGDERITLTMLRDGPPAPAPNQVQEDNVSKNISTKEQVEVRTQMAAVIQSAVEEKFGKCRTWVETETVGPLGGVSAKVLGAVEHAGKIVPFAIQVYSDERIVEALEEQLAKDAEDGKLRDKLGW